MATKMMGAARKRRLEEAGEDKSKDLIKMSRGDNGSLLQGRVPPMQRALPEAAIDKATRSVFLAASSFYL
jgi:hypothetical protein